MIANADPVQAVVRLRTLGPSGLNPPQIKVIDRLQTLTENEDSPITDLDVDVWGTGMGITQTVDCDPGNTRETVVEFKQWADAHGYALQPAFEWRSADSETEEKHGQIVTPLITPMYSIRCQDSERASVVSLAVTINPFQVRERPRLAAGLRRRAACQPRQSGFRGRRGVFRRCRRSRCAVVFACVSSGISLPVSLLYFSRQ